MLQITNQTLFNQIVAQSLAKVQNNTRWTNAIRKAVGKVEDESQATWMEFNAEANQLIIWSQGTDKVYSSNGICQCEAYTNGFPCWHRALARLMRLYTESLNTPPTTPAKVMAFPAKPVHEDTTAIYAKRQLNQPSEKLGGMRI